MSSWSIPEARIARAGRRPSWPALNLAALTLAVLVPLVLYPLAGLAWLAASGSHGFDPAGFVRVLADPRLADALGTTLGLLAVAAGSTAALGVALAAALHFLPVPGRRLLVRLMELFVAFPSFLVAFTLIYLYGARGSVNIVLMAAFGLHRPPLDFLFGARGVILAEIVFYTPFVVRPALAAFAAIDPKLIEAAASLGASPARVLARVVLPLAWPGIAAGIVLCFLYTLNEFGILLVLGSARLTTLPVAIYSAATVDLDLHRAAAEALVMLALSLALYAVYRAIERTRSRHDRR